MKSLWPSETWVTSCPVTQYHTQKTCQQHHCENLKSHFRSLFCSEASIFQSVWPQLESEILKAKLIFWKLHNFELNVAYMNCEGRIWIKILFWVIWLLADIHKICTRDIKFRSQDLISYITEVIIHTNVLHIIVCMTFHLSSLQGGFLYEYFTVWKSYEVMAYIFYIYCDLHISH